MSETYQCKACEKIFEYGRTDEDALKEFKETFPGIMKNEAQIVCEDCYIKIMDFNEPNKFRYSKYIVKS